MAKKKPAQKRAERAEGKREEVTVKAKRTRSAAKSKGVQVDALETPAHEIRPKG